MPWSLCPRIVRRAVAPALPLLLCLLAAPPCLAQAPSDRLALDAFRDSLARVGAVDSLAGFDSEGNSESRAVRTLRAGLVLLRRGELGRSRDPYDAAIRAVERALDLHADWPYAWYASGLVRLAMWDHGLVAKATHYQHAGESYRAAAMTAFGRALEADSGFVPAAAALSGILLSMGHGALPNRFTDVLQRAAVVRGMPASVPLVLARLRYAAGDLPDALAALAAYGDAGGDAGLQSLERARVLVASGRTEDAVRAYEAGLEVMGEDGRAEYRNDLAWIGTTGELARFDSLPANEVAGWIHNFWRERDVLSLRQSGERLAEHLRRWAYVHRYYLVHRPDDAPIHAAGEVPEDQQDLFAEYDEDVSVVMTSIGLGVPGFAPYRRTQWEIDDRGVIYLRHGEPDQTAFDPAAPPNESWAYDLPEGRRIFHFMGSRALGTTAATTLVAALPMDPDLLDSRGALDPRYSRIASDMQRRIDQVRGERVKYELANPGAVLERMQREAAALTGAAAAVQASAVAADKHRAAPSILEPETVYREVAAGRNAIAAALSTDGFPQHFDAALDAVAQVYAVGVSPEDPRLLVAFAVPGKRLAPVANRGLSGQMLYPVSFRVLALDRERGTLRELDTTRVFATPDTLRDNQYLTGLFELPVPPGTYQVRVLIQDSRSRAATGTGRDSVEVPGRSGSLVLSDLILGRAESGLTWHVGGDRVALNPLGVFSMGSDAELYYEIGGLVPSQHYAVSIAVRGRRDPAARTPRVRATFDVTASGPSERVHRTLGLAHLDPGEYLLVVSVEESSTERRVSRQQDLNILAR